MYYNVGINRCYWSHPLIMSDGIEHVMYHRVMDMCTSGTFSTPYPILEISSSKLTLTERCKEKNTLNCQTKHALVKKHAIDFISCIPIKE